MKRVALVLAVTLTGCAGEPATSLDVRAQLNRDMWFVRHDNGLCFAVAYTYNRDGYIRSFTNIPCISGDTVFVK